MEPNIRINNLDEIDKKILNFLQENARMPFLEVAKKCGISGAAVHQRVRKLEETGVINGSSFNINSKAIGYDFCAFIGVYLNSAQVYRKVIAKLKEIPEIVEAHFLTGHYSILIKLYCQNNEHLMEILINTIQNIPGVERTETFISLDQPIGRPIAI
jgi:Lrp/AsnC family transcriptional regulator for asnA, asnC and gidA